MACSNGVYDDPSRIIYLRDLLTGESSGGYWTVESSPVGFPISLKVNLSTQIINSSSVHLNGTDSPNVNFGNLCPGTYTFRYTIPASGSCSSYFSLATVEVKDEPCVSITQDSYTVCQVCNEAQDLPTLSTTISSSCSTGLPPAATFQWYVSTDDNTYNPIFGATNSFLPITSLTTDVWYKVVATSIANPSCSTYDKIKLTLGTNICPGNPSDVNVCSIPVSLVLTDYLVGETSGGTWTLISGTSGNVTGLPSASITISAVGTYVFRYTVNSGSCTEYSTITVTVSTPPSAGTPVPTTICN